jgi:predicted TIM-barrel fold metal-dependent hydrolase
VLRIDLHQHLWSVPLVEALARRTELPRVRRDGRDWVLEAAGEHPWPLPDDATGRRLGQLRRDGVDRALVSLSSPIGIEALPDADEARELIGAYHAGAQALPTGFGAWASVALADPERSDVDRALDAGFVGVSLPADAISSRNGLVMLGPVLEALERRDAPLFVHPGPAPWSPPRAELGPMPPWWPALTTYVAGMQAAWHAWADAGRAAHPRLRVVFSMLAGCAPIHAERLAARGGPAAAALDGEVFYDTSSYGIQAIDAMARAVGVDRLVHGSDRPVVEPTLPPLGEAAAHAMLVAGPARVLGARGLALLGDREAVAA